MKNCLLRSWVFLSLFFGQGVFAEEIKLALNWKPEPQFGGFYEAERIGLFKDLKVKILEGGSGTPTVQMLAQGTVDFGIVSAEEIILSQDKNKEKVIGLYAVFQTNPQVIVTRQERGFKSLQEVFSSDGILAWQSGLTYARFLEKKYSPLKVKTVPYTGGIGGLISEKNYSQQGFHTSEPILAEEKGLKIKSFLVADEGFNPYTTVLAAREDRLNSMDQIKAFVKAVDQGWKAYLKDPKQTNILMKKLNPSLTDSMLKASSEAQKKLIQVEGGVLGEMRPDRWRALQGQMKELGLVKGTPNPESYFRWIL